jgi:hypothetical protein
MIKEKKKMTIKVDHNGNATYTYDGESCWNFANEVVTFNALSNIAFGTNEETKKPEVRPDQRSSLEVEFGRIVARYYKDGFFDGSKDLIPAIKSIDVFNENTIKMTFVNGDTQTATVQGNDPYFFEDGLLRCIVKEMIGKEGTAVLSKLLSYATKFYNKAEADKKKRAEEEARKKAKSEKNYKKAKAHWAKKRAMEREKRIQEMAEAIVRAEEMKKNV